MRKDEMGDFFKAVASYLSLWDRKPDDEQMMLWWNSLKGCNLADVRKAFDELVRSSQWPPKPVDVLRLAPGESDARGRSCSVAGCAAPVVVDFGRPLCWVHSGDGKPTRWLAQHRWQVLLAGQFLLREKGDEARARAMYGDRAVDFVLNNPQHEDVRRFTEPPKPDAAPRKPAASEKTLAEAIPREMQAAVRRRQEAARRMEARLNGEPADEGDGFAAGEAIDDEDAASEACDGKDAPDLAAGHAMHDENPAARDAAFDEDAAADRLCASLQEQREGERQMREAADARAEHQGAFADEPEVDARAKLQRIERDAYATPAARDETGARAFSSPPLAGGAGGGVSLCEEQARSGSAANDATCAADACADARRIGSDASTTRSSREPGDCGACASNSLPLAGGTGGGVSLCEEQSRSANAANDATHTSTTREAREPGAQMSLAQVSCNAGSAHEPVANQPHTGEAA